MSEQPMMMCGHSAQGVDGTGAPVCVVCFGRPEAATVAPAPDLGGRMATCTYKDGGKLRKHPDGAPVPSSTSLAFFKRHPTAATDEYYCGCWGWD